MKGRRRIVENGENVAAAAGESEKCG